MMITMVMMIVVMTVNDANNIEGSNNTTTTNSTRRAYDGGECGAEAQTTRDERRELSARKHRSHARLHDCVPSVGSEFVF